MIYHLFVYDCDEAGGIHNFKGAFESGLAAERYLNTFNSGYAHLAVFDDDNRTWDIVMEFMYCTYGIENENWTTRFWTDKPRWIAHSIDSLVGWFEIEHAS